MANIGSMAIPLPNAGCGDRAHAGIRRWGAGALDSLLVPPAATTRSSSSWARAWDVAAGLLLVRDGGGVISDYPGQALRIGRTRRCCQQFRTARFDGRDPVQGLTAPSGAAVERGSAMAIVERQIPWKGNWLCQRLRPLCAASPLSFSAWAPARLCAGTNVTALGTRQEPASPAIALPAPPPGRSRAVSWRSAPRGRCLGAPPALSPASFGVSAARHNRPGPDRGRRAGSSSPPSTERENGGGGDHDNAWRPRLADAAARREPLHRPRPCGPRGEARSGNPPPPKAPLAPPYRSSDVAGSHRMTGRRSMASAEPRRKRPRLGRSARLRHRR